MFGGQVAKLLSLFENKTVLPQPSRQEILRALSIPDEEAERIVDVGVQDGWFVFGLQNERSVSSQTASAPQAKSDFTTTARVLGTGEIEKVVGRLGP
jgi:hypothetical protein